MILVSKMYGFDILYNRVSLFTHKRITCYVSLNFFVFFFIVKKVFFLYFFIINKVCILLPLIKELLSLLLFYFFFILYMYRKLKLTTLNSLPRL